VGALAAEDEHGVQVAQAARVDLGVGRLEHDDEVGVEHERRLGKDPREGALLRWELLADEEEEREIAAELRPARGPVRELDHDGEPALHVARPEAFDPAVLDPAGEVPLFGHGVEVPREQDERPPRPLRRVEQRLVGPMGERKRHLLRHVREQSRLLSARGRDVHELQRPLCEVRRHRRRLARRSPDVSVLRKPFFGPRAGNQGSTKSDRKGFEDEVRTE
jgi:hypothetical protein